ncbi:hypothetical protein DsansV1_C29g0211071 [Dioscorea sansibarensis]
MISFSSPIFCSSPSLCRISLHVFGGIQSLVLLSGLELLLYGKNENLWVFEYGIFVMGSHAKRSLVVIALV